MKTQISGLFFAWLFILGLTGTGCPTLSTSPDASTNPERPATEQKPTSLDPLEGIAALETVSDKFAFSEGPLWDAANKRLLFSDILTNQIYQLKPPSTIESFRKPSDFSNGLAFDHKGRLLAGERVKRRVTRTLSDGTVEVFVDKFEGNRFHGPNDITVRSDGMVYFTDPPYALAESSWEIPFNGVFRVSSEDKKPLPIWKGGKESRPNGLILSKDEKRLYFADAAAAIIWVADVQADGAVQNTREFTKTAETPDGMTIDENENLYSATRDGIQVFDKTGKLWGVIKTPIQPTNCTFGGADRKTLYITARAALYRIPNMPFAGTH